MNYPEQVLQILQNELQSNFQNQLSKGGKIFAEFLEKREYLFGFKKFENYNYQLLLEELEGLTKDLQKIIKLQSKIFLLKDIIEDGRD